MKTRLLTLVAGALIGSAVTSSILGLWFARRPVTLSDCAPIVEVQEKTRDALDMCAAELRSSTRALVQTVEEFKKAVDR